uniref:CSON015406 protein n=1 Tax=Culicoides sonorensis TaxID=179676 RepID=A0A336LPE9_CULSO
MKLFVFNTIFIVSLFFCKSNCAKFPTEIVEQCPYSDSTCLARTINSILPNHFNGIRKLNLVPFDPLKIEKMDIVQGGNSPVNIVLNFKDVDFLGLSGAQVKTVKGFEPDFKNKKVEIRVTIPIASLLGNYKINGRVLVLPIQGEGRSNLTLTNADIGLKFLPKSVMKGDKEYMQVDKIKLVVLNLDRLNIFLGNLFNGDKLLGDNMNEFLNENWKDIWNELKAPNIVQQCTHGDNSCVMQAVNYVIKNYPAGVKKLGLVSLDPLKIDKMDIEQGENSPVNIVLNFKNIDLLGLSQTVVSSLTGFEKNLNRKKIELRGLIPMINFVGNYKIQGRILVLPITGDGKSNITLSNTNFILKLLPKSIIKGGKEYMQVDKLKLKLSTKRVFTFFSNLFNGDEALGENMNTFMNDNWKQIWPELQPIVEDSIAYILKDLMNNIFTNIPYNDLFIE